MPRKLAKSHGSAAQTTTVSSTTTQTETTPLQPPSPSTPVATAAMSRAVPVLTDGQPLPRLMVFDLDYTLWPLWVDTHVTVPIRPASSHANIVSAPTATATTTATAVVDRIGDTYTFYPDVPAILAALPGAGVRVAAASRTHAPELAREMLKLLHIVPPVEGSGAIGGDGGAKKEKPRRALEFFDAGLEIYPGSKLRHMEALAKRTGIPYTDMLFFDDEGRNRVVETLGVTMWLVADGLNWAEIDRGVKEWRARRGIR